jgi:hypothetical protein
MEQAEHRRRRENAEVFLSAEILLRNARQGVIIDTLEVMPAKKSRPNHDAREKTR